MAENSKIEWCDHTFNPWRGCTKVSPGCEHCYAAVQAKRNPAVLGVWGDHGARVVASEAQWKLPLKWNREAACCCRKTTADHEHEAGCPQRRRPRIFCASMADVFEDWNGIMVGSDGSTLHNGPDWGVDKPWIHVEDVYIGKSVTTMDDVRRRLFDLIDATPNLDWLILSKRPENFHRILTKIDSAEYYAQTKRTIRVPSNPIKGAGDRLRGEDLASDEANGGPVDWRSEDDAMQAGSCRSAERVGIPSSSGDEKRNTVLRSGTSIGVDSPERSDTKCGDHQPQKRHKERQSTGQPGIGDVQRTATPRNQGSRRTPLELQRNEPPEDEVDGGRCSQNEAAANERGASQTYCSGLSNDTEISERNSLSPDMEARPIKIRPNVWLGVTVEDQQRAEERIPLLLQVPATVRFLSVEPMLGPVDLTAIRTAKDCEVSALSGVYRQWSDEGIDHPGAEQRFDGGPRIHWVICGGESGHGARPMYTDWVRSLRDQCQAAGVPFFFKQLGEFNLQRPGLVGKKNTGRLLDGRTWDEFPKVGRT